MSTPFGAWLRAKRERAGYSLNGMARELGITSSFLSSVELGNSPPLIDERLEAAARLLNVDIDAAYAAAGRLPPDMRPHIAEIIAAWRKKKKRRSKFVACSGHRSSG
jgi:transcriptional regulator with XRE-family HTH domain